MAGPKIDKNTALEKLTLHKVPRLHRNSIFRHFERFFLFRHFWIPRFDNVLPNGLIYDQIERELLLLNLRNREYREQQRGEWDLSLKLLLISICFSAILLFIVSFL